MTQTPKLLYVGAMFHDLGLTDRYRFDADFERTDFERVILGNDWPAYPRSRDA